MTVHLPKRALAAATVAISQLWFAVPALSQEEMSAEERFNLCSAFPLNSRCEGYTAPVALKQRSGNEGVCKMQVGATETAGRCKILLTNELITVFVEEGDKLSLLDDERDTREISVGVGDVANLSYRETKKIDIVEFLFITWLEVFRPDKFSEITINFAETAQSDVSSVTFITDREMGINIKSYLERSTGLFANILLDEEDEAEIQEPALVENPDPEPENLEAFCQDFPLNSRCQASESR